MELNDFYKHALQWKRQQEEIDRRRVEEEQERLRNSWKPIAALIREALPIEGMTLHETQPGQFNEYPKVGYLIEIDAHFSKEQVTFPPPGPKPGAIRITLRWDKEETEGKWLIVAYKARINDEIVRFDNPYDAFIALYATLEKN